VLVVLALFGGWKFLQAHNAQNNVDTLQQSISSLNAQVPKYDLVVAANNAYSAGVTRRASVLNSAVDWPLALTNLISITPANAQVQTFTGEAVAPSAAAASSASSTTTAASTSAKTTAASSTTTSAAIGTIQLGVTGPGPSLSISEAWIDAVAGSQLFANPLQGATVVNSDTTISFPFSVSITPNASLDKNASLK
jgi:hypothetical protein